MPSKVDDRGQERDTSKPESRERRRHRSSRTKSKSTKDAPESAAAERSTTLADSATRRKISMPVPELQRRASSSNSLNGSKISLPYPSFSKAHSREAVGSTDNIASTPRHDPLTPDPTDIQKRTSTVGDQDKMNVTAAAQAMNGPPSPPLTADYQAAVLEEKRRNLETQGEEMRRKLSETRDGKGRVRESGRSSSLRASPLKPSRISSKSSVPSLRKSKSSAPTAAKGRQAAVDEDSSVVSKQDSRTASPASSSRTATEVSASSAVHSDSTSIAPKQHAAQTPFSPTADDEFSSVTATDSSAKTPTPRGTPAPSSQTPVYSVNGHGYTESLNDSPMPPPPPPPPSMPMMMTAPRVDYLMQNGGLGRSVPKNFLSAPDPVRAVNYTVGEQPNASVMAAQVEKFFAPFSGLLDDYTKVMEKSGSIAVATGYRSIARRLLDRLEAVFARDISSEVCACVMCDTMDDQTMGTEVGVSWGEILEYVCGRQELPAWPPFYFDQEPTGLGISDFTTPMQKLDIDVPEEYREHYIRQSKKTKQSVDRWLAGQTNDTSGPPDEADDDTLTFAILTYLEPGQRAVFSQLLGVAISRPPSIQPSSRTQTPLNAPKSELLSQTGLAIQRLYRLNNSPRPPECALYLLNNQQLHNVLATLAAISDGEWDILTSGRFDGFLRSGAEDLPANTALPPSRGPSRGGASRGPQPPASPSPLGPASAGAPVAMDEETEIAVLAEVEREIYLGMEALEDAFEALHVRAEVVRRSLRERSAGLSMASQARKGSDANILEARLGTPASARGWDSETDDGIDDMASEIAPDDSASNVSSSRHRRPKRRVERRTPAPVEEESGEDDDAGNGGRAKARVRERESRAGRRR